MIRHPIEACYQSFVGAGCSFDRIGFKNRNAVQCRIRRNAYNVNRVVARRYRASDMSSMTVKILARTTIGVESIDALNLGCEAQVGVIEIQSCIDDRDADTCARPRQSAWSSTYPLHTRRYDLCTRRSDGSGRLNGIRIT